MTRRFALLATLNLALLTTGAMAEPWVKKYDPPTSGYSPEKPDYAWFKEIEVTRKSSRDLDVDITLQGPIAKNMPKDYGVNYYLYIDLVGYVGGRDKVQTEAFQSDHTIMIYLEPNSPTSKNFKVFTKDLFHRSKLWPFDVTEVRASGDKVSFSVKSPLFNEKDIPIRMQLVSSMTHWEGGNTSKRNEKANDGIHYTEPFDLPTKSAP